MLTAIEFVEKGHSTKYVPFNITRVFFIKFMTKFSHTLVLLVFLPFFSVCPRFLSKTGDKESVLLRIFTTDVMLKL